jgi:hypothetical protein
MKNRIVESLLSSPYTMNCYMANTLSTHVGPTYAAAGSPAAFDARQGEHGETIMQQLSGEYSEQCKRGNIYAGQATGLTPTTAISGTTSAPLVLYNPFGSGKRLKLLKVGYGPAATGTLGSGTVFHCGFTLNGPTATQTGVIPTGTAITPICLDLGNANQSVAVLLSTATLHAAAAALYPLASQGEEVGGTTATQPSPIVEEVKGCITLEPGGGYTNGTVSAAGSSPLVDIGFVWEEEAIAA